MSERERNKKLWDMVSVLKEHPECMELLGTMINNDTPSMKMTFKLLTQGSPIASFLGVENLSDQKN